MKKKLKYISIFLLVSTLIIAGVVFFFRHQLIKHYAPAVKEIGDISIVVKNDTSYVSAKLVVQNNSFLKIAIDTLDYKISLFNKTYLQNKISLGIQLPGFGSDTVDFSLKIPFVAILKDLKIEQKKGDSAGYSINVSLHYATILGKSSIPINKAAKLKIPQPPELKIISIKWKRLRLKSIQAVAKIKIINYSPVSLIIKNMNYSMRILKQGNLKGNYNKSIVITPKGTSFIDLPLEIDVNSIGKTLFQILINKDKYNYVLTLNAAMESTNPVKEIFHVNFTQKGKVELKK